MTDDSGPERRRLAELLSKNSVLTSPWLREAVETVPRELFLHPGVFLDEGGFWRPVTATGTDAAEWLKIAYSYDTLTTQLDGHLTADQTAHSVRGVPTSSSTTPATVISMIESLGLEPDHRVLEIGTGTGYSSALMCHYLGADNVSTVEVDPEVAERADIALETLGYSAWTAAGDGLLGHPRRAPYDRVIATCAVRRIPHTWVRQTKPGGIILSTVGSWPYGTGLAKVTVDDNNGNAEGQIIGRSSFMQARSQAVVPVAGDLSARTAYADSERETKAPPTLLDDWMPAFLAQLAAPGAHLVRAQSDETPLLYLFDPDRESFAEFIAHDGGWTVRQGGPVPLWDRIEEALVAWEAAGQPEIDSFRLRITQASHHYWIEGAPDLNWEHRLD
ncbi:ATP-grasp peptide maturase system methyltransferase [Streptomyces bauhiniae]